MINNIVILPEPAEFFLMKGSANDDLITSAVFPGMEEEAYRIRAEEKGITILAGSEKGLKRAEASLSQIRLQCYFGGQAAVPCFRLYDRPKQRERIYRLSGVAADEPGPSESEGEYKTRTAIKGTEALLQEIRLAAFLKYNVFELAMPGAVSDIRALEEACSGFGMEFRYTGETSAENREGINSESEEKKTPKKRYKTDSETEKKTDPETEEINGWHSALGYDRIAVLKRAAERAETLWCRESGSLYLTGDGHGTFPEHEDRAFTKHVDRTFSEHDERGFPEQDSRGFRERFDRLLPFFEMILDPEDPGEGDLTT